MMLVEVAGPVDAALNLEAHEQAVEPVVEGYVLGVVAVILLLCADHGIVAVHVNAANKLGVPVLLGRNLGHLTKIVECNAGVGGKALKYGIEVLTQNHVRKNLGL